MVELSDYSDDIGRVDVAARTSSGLVTVRETRSDANDQGLEIVVVDDDRTEWESIQITPDQFGVLPIAMEEESDHP